MILMVPSSPNHSVILISSPGKGEKKAEDEPSAARLKVHELDIHAKLDGQDDFQLSCTLWNG